MEYPASVVLDWLANYFWPYTRISSMLMVMTVTGARFVSPRIRLYLGLAITFAVMPAIPAVPQDIELLSFKVVLTLFGRAARVFFAKFEREKLVWTCGARFFGKI